MYYYKSFTLLIESEIKFPELLETTKTGYDTVRLTIKIGSTPNTLVGADVTQNVWNWISPTEYLLTVLNIARFHFCTPNQLMIEPLNKNIDWRSIRIFALTAAFPMILHYKNLLPIRATAVCYQDGVMLFGGTAGVGKSTIGVFLRERGYRLFSDNICILNTESIDPQKKLMVSAAYPMIGLWKDTIEELKNPNYNQAYQFRKNISKYGHFFHDSFIEQPLPIKGIFQIFRHNHGTFEQKSVDKVGEKMAVLRDLTHHKGVPEGSNRRITHFKILTKLAAIPLTKLYRPYRDKPFSNFIDFIENEYFSTTTV